MSTPPPVSWVMPAYNAERWLSAALDSILCQTMPDFEVVVIDDASSDGTWSVLQDYATRDDRIKPFQNERNLHVAGTLNRAIGLATGHYLARLDADDVALPDRLERQFRFMEANPSVVVCGAAMDVCDEDLNVLTQRFYYQTDEAIRAKLFRFSPFCHPGVMMRTEAVRRVGGYADLSPAEDYDLFLRLGKVGSFANLPDVLTRYRSSAQGISRSQARLQERLTLEIRRKAWDDYGYEKRSADVAYWWAQRLSQSVMPTSWRFWVFAHLRARLRPS